jgi:ankyrin repeat domain-containing protein 50
VKALLEAGARVREVDNDNRIPLILAAQEGHLSVVMTLANSASPLEARGHDGKTALHVATLENHDEVVRYLIAARANVDTVDSDGRTPLYAIALDNRVSMAIILLDEGRASTERAGTYRDGGAAIGSWGQSKRDGC